ncbi:hypothetical protein GR140_18760 [Pseudomonas putida]|uniref:hypothetical protein n=1 Tax=Pseudomonas putida TaxID=303 RepID=UPI001BAE7F35|nr:hypothetical protein [Pseudomonas putida]QUG90706.1 hypothetical protein GR140_18760 [Pseudomonas putida]
MDAIQKAKSIASQISDLNNKPKDPHEIAGPLQDDLEEYLSLLDNSNENQIMESLELINSTGIPVFIELGIEDRIKDKIPMEYLVNYYTTRNEEIEFNGRLISKYDLAKTIEQLKFLADCLHGNLLFNQGIDTLNSSGDNKVKSINSGELL